MPLWSVLAQISCGIMKEPALHFPAEHPVASLIPWSMGLSESTFIGNERFYVGPRWQCGLPGPVSKMSVMQVTRPEAIPEVELFMITLLSSSQR